MCTWSCVQKSWVSMIYAKDSTSVVGRTFLEEFCQHASRMAGPNLVSLLLKKLDAQPFPTHSWAWCSHDPGTEWDPSVPQSDHTHRIITASLPFIIKSKAIVPGCYHPLLGVLHLFVHLGIVTFIEWVTTSVTFLFFLASSHHVLRANSKIRTHTLCILLATYDVETAQNCLCTFFCLWNWHNTPFYFFSRVSLQHLLQVNQAYLAIWYIIGM